VFKERNIIYLRYSLLISLFTMVNSVMADQWFRGNTHAHTTLSGHADSSPEKVANGTMTMVIIFLF